MTRTIRGVIFDVDGTLLNSNDAHARAWVEALAEANVQVTFEEVRKLIGMGGDKLLPRLANIEHGSDLGKQLGERRSTIFEQRFLSKLRPFPHTRDLLLRMQNFGLKLAIASSAQQPELDRFLKIAEVLDLIEASASSTDASNSKPDPDIVQAALARLGLRAEQVMMIGDTPYDIEAAARAGIETLAFRCGGRSDADLSGALAIYDDPADLLARFDESPLAKGR
jgi:HAD superfamily hydrolase (TIGR01549 family)